MWKSLIVLSICSGQAFGGTLEEAWADLQKTPTDLQPLTRYLTLDHLPVDQRANAVKVLNYHINTLSREPVIMLPGVVTADAGLLRVNLSDYGWRREVWEKFAEKDPYYHVRIKVAKTKEEVLQSASAPWLAETETSKAAIAGLINLTQSQCPIVRGDWFFSMTAIQEGREGHGYYDFLSIGKKEEDFEELIGLDIKLAKKQKKEISGVVAKSTVTLNNRRLVRMQTILGGYWFSVDARESVDKRNYLRILDKGAEFDATEQIGTLPNGLHAYWLADAQGNRQNFAPDFIASDSTAPGTDRRVHISLSCTRCHEEGFRPINDYVRNVILKNTPLTLQSPDYEVTKRLRQLYLSDLDGNLARDNADFAMAVGACNGWTTKENSLAYGSFWAKYVEEPVLLQRACEELNCTSEQLVNALSGQLKTVGQIDAVVAAYLANPPTAIRREQFEEAFPLMMYAIRGLVP